MPNESAVRAWGAALGAHSAWRLAVAFLLLPATFYYMLHSQTLNSAICHLPSHAFGIFVALLGTIVERKRQFRQDNLAQMNDSTGSYEGKGDKNVPVLAKC